MRIVIVGAGRVGYYIAERLVKEAQDVVLIEQDEAVRASVQKNLDILTLQGNGASPKALKEAGCDAADIVLAITNQDEVNIVTCRTARFLNPHALLIARISNPEYFNESSPLTPSSFGIDTVINPERECGEQIASLLKTPHASETADFADGRVQLVGLKIEEKSPLAGSQLKDLRGGIIDLLRFVALEREDRVIIPRGENFIRPGDRVFIVGDKRNMTQIFSFLGIREPQLERVVIYGGRRIGKAVLDILEKEDISIKLLEPSEAIATSLAETLNKTIVISGDATDIQVLRESGADAADAFVAVGQSDEGNILSCVLAKQLGIPKAIASIEKPEYLRIAENMAHVDAVVSPRLAAVNTILRFVRKGRIISAMSLQDIEAETLEIEVPPQARIAGKPLRETAPKLLQDAVVGAIVRQDEVIIPTGDTVIETNDKVILFTLPSAIKSVEKAFARSRLSLHR